MVDRLIVIGASTPTVIRVVEDINAAGGRRIRINGFLDNAHAGIGPRFHGYPVLGGFDAIASHAPGDVVLINTVAGSCASRVETTRYFLDRGYRFTTIVHPGVNVGHVSIGTGSLVYEGALIQPYVDIGEHCVISSNSGIAHDSSVGAYCFVGPASYVCGKVAVEDRVYIGTGAKILPRLRLGAGAVIGACALVHRDVPAGRRVMGVPGREG